MILYKFGFQELKGGKNTKVWKDFIGLCYACEKEVTTFFSPLRQVNNFLQKTFVKKRFLALRKYCNKCTKELLKKKYHIIKSWVIQRKTKAILTLVALITLLLALPLIVISAREAWGQYLRLEVGLSREPLFNEQKYLDSNWFNYPVIYSITGPLIYSTSPLIALQRLANEYLVSEYRLIKTMTCESGLRENAIGDNGNSIGLFQIHLPSHPTITKECGLNLSCISPYAIKLFKRNPYAWTCYRKLFSQL